MSTAAAAAYATAAVAGRNSVVIGECDGAYAAAAGGRECGGEGVEAERGSGGEDVGELRRRRGAEKGRRSGEIGEISDRHFWRERAISGSLLFHNLIYTEFGVAEKLLK